MAALSEYICIGPASDLCSWSVLLFLRTSLLLKAIVLSRTFCCVVWPCSVPMEFSISSGKSRKQRNLSCDEPMAISLRADSKTFFMYCTVPDTAEPLSLFTVFFVKLSSASYSSLQSSSIYSHQFFSRADEADLRQICRQKLIEQCFALSCFLLWSPSAVQSMHRTSRTSSLSSQCTPFLPRFQCSRFEIYSRPLY